MKLHPRSAGDRIVEEGAARSAQRGEHCKFVAKLWKKQAAARVDEIDLDGAVEDGGAAGNDKQVVLGPCDVAADFDRPRTARHVLEAMAATPEVLPISSRPRFTNPTWSSVAPPASVISPATPLSSVPCPWNVASATTSVRPVICSAAAASAKLVTLSSPKVASAVIRTQCATLTSPLIRRCDPPTRFRKNAAAATPFRFISPAIVQCGARLSILIVNWPKNPAPMFRAPS